MSRVLACIATRSASPRSWRLGGVLVREGDRLEIAGGEEYRRIVGRVVGQLRRRHHRQRRADLGALGGVVVKKHKSIEADPQRPGDRLEVEALSFQLA